MTDICFRLGQISVPAFMATLIACSPTKTTDDLILCTEPRPEICTMDYDPVCGLRKASGIDQWKTYSNECTACADASVVGYKAGACS